MMAELTVETMNDNGSAPINWTTSSPSGRGARDADYYFVWVYVSPWILVIGVAGNVLTLIVMTRRRMRGSSACVYLSAIAIADTLALLLRIPSAFFEAARLFVFRNLSRLELYRLPHKAQFCVQTYVYALLNIQF